MTDKPFTHTFHGDPSPVDPQDLAVQMFGTPSPEEVAQEADAFLAMCLAASLSPEQVLQYLDGAPWRTRDTGEDVIPSPDADIELPSGDGG